MKATLLNNVGFVEDEDGKCHHSFDYIGKTGEIIDIEDSGYEPVYYLVKFEDGVSLWIPSSSYCGYNYDIEKDVFTKHLKITK